MNRLLLCRMSLCSEIHLTHIFALPLIQIVKIRFLRLSMGEIFVYLIGGHEMIYIQEFHAAPNGDSYPEILGVVSVEFTFRGFFLKINA